MFFFTPSNVPFIKFVTMPKKDAADSFRVLGIFDILFARLNKYLRDSITPRDPLDYTCVYTERNAHRYFRMTQILFSEFSRM